MAALGPYAAKRNFSKTAEPEPKPESQARRKGPHRRAGLAYVVQKHAARRLHYDLRLELDGVLKSFAVTRGPSLVPGDKRLAIQVEDHPLDYAGFEGPIPEGEYGAGTVIVWDRGSWIPEADPRAGLEKGRLSFELKGEKLRGSWHLVRMHRRRGEKRDSWLLIKQKDQAARSKDAPDILDERPESVLSGLALDELTEGSSPGKGARKPARGKMAKDKAGSAGLPGFVPPCLATLAAKPPAGERWLHEVKFDGYRIQARVLDGKVTLFTPSGQDWSLRFGKGILAALAGLDAESLVIDGEVVAEGEAGASDFAALQADLSAGRTERLRYYAFDLLHHDGVDLRKDRLEARQRRLHEILAGLDGKSPLRQSEPFAESGELVLEHACRLSLEGIVSKRRAAPYRSGRNRDWIKSKCADRQEFVVAGWTPSTVTPRAVGSLVLAYYQEGELVHAGRVGTGFGRAVAKELWQRLDALEETAMPFAQRPERSDRDVHWVRPELVAEVEYRGWTGELLLRHAAFRGLRDDKPAAEIVREEAPAPETKAPAPKKKARSRAGTVKLTHPDRIYWPDAGITKQGLADYYAEIWPWMAPHVVARPLSLLRCPSGIDEKCFFQKAPWRGLHRAISVLENPGEGGETVLAIENLEGMIALVQAGVLELHPWGARIDDLDHPDQLTFDLDPGEGAGWAQLKDAAWQVRERLRAAGLESYLKTSGGKGLHVVVPLQPEADWAAAKSFARGLADAMSADSPDLYTATMARNRRHGRIFVDWLRNSRGNTAIAAYSSRARAGAPVAAPLAWSELDQDVRETPFDVANLPLRLDRLREDPWAGFFRLRQVLPAAPKPGRRAKR